jgi:hypothetical protein
MADIPPILVQIQADVAQLKAGLTQAEASLKSLDGNVSKTDQGFGKFTDRLKSVGAALGATFAVGSVVSFFKQSISAAMEASAVQTRLAEILRNTGGATEAQIVALNAQAEALAKVGVASKENIMTTQSQLATFDLQAKTINTLTPAILDYVVAEKGATASSEDYKQMTNGLAQALNGNFGALTRVGFVLDEDTKKKIANGTESERAAAITEVLNSTYKDFNKTVADTPEGRMIKLKQEFGDLQQEVGEALLPAMEGFAKVLSNVVIPAIRKLMDFIKNNSTEIKAFAIALGIGATAWGVYTLAVKRAEIAQKLLNLAQKANPIGIVITAVALLVAGIVKLWRSSETFRNVVINVAKVALNAFASIIPMVAKVFEAIAKIVTGPMRLFLGALSKLPGVGKYAKSGLDMINKGLDGISDMGDKAAKKAKELSGKLDELAKKGKKAAEETEKAGKKAKDVWAGSKDPAGGGGKDDEKRLEKIKSLKEKATALLDDMAQARADALERLEEAEIARDEKVAEAKERYAERVVELNEQYQERVAEANERYGEQIANAEKRRNDARIEAQERAAERIADLNERYQERVADANERYNDVLKEAAERRDEAIEEATKRAQEKIADLREKYAEKVAEAEKRYAEKSIEAAERRDQTILEATEKFKKRELEIEKAYNAKRTELTKNFEAKILELQTEAQRKREEITQKGQERLAEIVEQSRERLREAWRSGTAFSLSDLFGENVKTAGASELISNLSNQLEMTKVLLQKAGELSAAGYTQTFIEQIVAAGPDAGTEMANALLELDDATQAQIQEMYMSLETLNKDGVNDLANTMSNSTSFATAELAEMYNATKLEIKAALEAVDTELKASVAESKAVYEAALAEAATARDEALTEAKVALDAALAEAKKTYDDAIADAKKTLNDALLAAKKDLEEGITAAQKALQDAIAKANEEYTKQITKAKEALDKALLDAKKELDKNIEETQKALTKALEDIDKAYNEALEEAKKDLDKALADAKKSLDKGLEDAQKALNKAIEDAMKAFEKNIDDINTSLDKKLATLKSKIAEVAKDLAELNAKQEAAALLAASTAVSGKGDVLGGSKTDSASVASIRAKEEADAKSLTVNQTFNSMRVDSYDVHQATLNAIRYGQAVIPDPVTSTVGTGGAGGGQYGIKVK